MQLIWRFILESEQRQSYIHREAGGNAASGFNLPVGLGPGYARPFFYLFVRIPSIA